jgi:hypothetical protein
MRSARVSTGDAGSLGQAGQLAAQGVELAVRGHQSRAAREVHTGQEADDQVVGRAGKGDVGCRVVEQCAEPGAQALGLG